MITFWMDGLNVYVLQSPECSIDATAILGTPIAGDRFDRRVSVFLWTDELIQQLVWSLWRGVR